MHSLFNKHTAIGIGDKLWDSFLTISIRKKSDQACQTGVCHLWNVGSTATNSLNGWSYKLLISTGNIALGKKKKKGYSYFSGWTYCLLWQIFCKVRSFFVSNYIVSVAVSDRSFFFSCMNIRYFSICTLTPSFWQQQFDSHFSYLLIMWKEN